MDRTRTGTTSETDPRQVASELTTAVPLTAIGNQAMARFAGPATPAPITVARDGRQTTSDDPDVALYNTSVEERATFLGQSFFKDPHQPSSGIGLFGATFSGGTLKITVKCAFEFTNSWWIQYPRSPEKDRTWQPGEADAWKATFMSQVKSVWSGKHTFHCQKDWWEDMTATTEIEVVEVSKGAHFDCQVQKIPPKEFRTSSVSSPIFGGRLGGGSADFDSNDINSVPKGGGNQRASVHEAGHMFGLDDEYGDADEEVDHSKIVEDQGGGKVVRGDDGRVMSGGEDVGTPHGATFLEVLKEITKLDWGNAPKSPKKPIPAGAMGDFPVPAPRQPGDSVPV